MELEKKAQTEAVLTEEVVDVVVDDGTAMAGLEHDPWAHPVDVAAVVDLAILQADVEVYAAIIDGGACVLKIGPGSFDPHADERCAEAARAWDRRFEGDQWCVWTQK